ncbi:MAG: hypothetical protein M1835_004593 [Candelina submexicana]|nr:MAG: hypothetical protein M1835_004593 [Candelina submexicana]
MRKPNSSYGRTYMTKSNGPPVSLLSTYRPQIIEEPKSTSGNDRKDWTSIAIDAEPLSSSDESSKPSPPKIKPSPSPPHLVKQRKSVVRVPKWRPSSWREERLTSPTETQIDKLGFSHVNSTVDGRSVESRLQQASKQDGDLSNIWEKESEGLRKDEDEEDDYSWVGSQQSKRRRFQAESTHNIHGNGRQAAYGKASKKHSTAVGKSDSFKASDGFKDPRRYKPDSEAQQSAPLAPVFRDPSNYARSQSPESTDSNHDAPMLSQGSDSPRFRMPPKPPESRIGSSQSVDSPQFRMPASSKLDVDEPLDVKKESGTQLTIQNTEKQHMAGPATDVGKVAKDAITNVRRDLIHTILDDQVPTSSTTSFSAPSAPDDMAFHSDDSSLSSPPASPVLDSSQVREVITIPDSSQESAILRCPLCKEAVDEDFLDQVQYGRRMGVQKQAKFCRTHKQRSARKEWKARRYPAIEWGRLNARLNTHHHSLEDILDGRKASFYKNKLKDSIKTGTNRTMAQSMGSAGFHSLTPGYYGSQGARIMMDNIMSKFSDKLRRLAATDKVCSSYGVSAFLQLVLVPELAVLLIREDMDVKEEIAREILEDSIEIGDLLHEDQDDEIKTLAFEHGVEGQ